MSWDTYCDVCDLCFYTKERFYEHTDSQFHRERANNFYSNDSAYCRPARNPYECAINWHSVNRPLRPVGGYWRRPSYYPQQQPHRPLLHFPAGPVSPPTAYPPPRCGPSDYPRNYDNNNIKSCSPISYSSFEDHSPPPSFPRTRSTCDNAGSTVETLTSTHTDSSTSSNRLSPLSEVGVQTVSTAQKKDSSQQPQTVQKDRPPAKAAPPPLPLAPPPPPPPPPPVSSFLPPSTFPSCLKSDIVISKGQRSDNKKKVQFRFSNPTEGKSTATTSFSKATNSSSTCHTSSNAKPTRTCCTRSENAASSSTSITSCPTSTGYSKCTNITSLKPSKVSSVNPTRTISTAATSQVVVNSIAKSVGVSTCTSAPQTSVKDSTAKITSTASIISSSKPQVVANSKPNIVISVMPRRVAKGPSLGARSEPVVASRLTRSDKGTGKVVVTTSPAAYSSSAVSTASCSGLKPGAPTVSSMSEVTQKNPNSSSKPVAAQRPATKPPQSKQRAGQSSSQTRSGHQTKSKRKKKPKKKVIIPGEASMIPPEKTKKGMSTKFVSRSTVQTSSSLAPKARAVRTAQLDRTTSSLSLLGRPTSTVQSSGNCSSSQAYASPISCASKASRSSALLPSAGEKGPSLLGHPGSSTLSLPQPTPLFASNSPHRSPYSIQKSPRSDVTPLPPSSLSASKQPTTNKTSPLITSTALSQPSVCSQDSTPQAIRQDVTCMSLTTATPLSPIVTSCLVPTSLVVSTNATRAVAISFANDTVPIAIAKLPHNSSASSLGDDSFHTALDSTPKDLSRSDTTLLPDVVDIYLNSSDEESLELPIVCCCATASQMPNLSLPHSNRQAHTETVNVHSKPLPSPGLSTSIVPPISASHRPEAVALHSNACGDNSMVHRPTSAILSEGLESGGPYSQEVQRHKRITASPLVGSPSSQRRKGRVPVRRPIERRTSEDDAETPTVARPGPNAASSIAPITSSTTAPLATMTPSLSPSVVSRPSLVPNSGTTAVSRVAVFTTEASTGQTLKTVSEEIDIVVKKEPISPKSSCVHSDTSNRLPPPPLLMVATQHTHQVSLESQSEPGNAVTRPQLLPRCSWIDCDNFTIENEVSSELCHEHSLIAKRIQSDLSGNSETNVSDVSESEPLLFGQARGAPLWLTNPVHNPSSSSSDLEELNERSASKSVDSFSGTKEQQSHTQKTGTVGEVRLEKTPPTATPTTLMTADFSSSDHRAVQGSNGECSEKDGSDKDRRSTEQSAGRIRKLSDSSISSHQGDARKKRRLVSGPVHHSDQVSGRKRRNPSIGEEPQPKRLCTTGAAEVSDGQSLAVDVAPVELRKKFETKIKSLNAEEGEMFQAIMDHHTEYSQLCVRESSVDAEKESHSNKALFVKDKAKELTDELRRVLVEKQEILLHSSSQDMMSHLMELNKKEQEVQSELLEVQKVLKNENSCVEQANQRLQVIRNEKVAEKNKMDELATQYQNILSKKLSTLQLFTSSTLKLPTSTEETVADDEHSESSSSTFTSAPTMPRVRSDEWTVECSSKSSGTMAEGATTLSPLTALSEDGFEVVKLKDYTLSRNIGESSNMHVDTLTLHPQTGVTESAPSTAVALVGPENATDQTGSSGACTATDRETGVDKDHTSSPVRFDVHAGSVLSLKVYGDQLFSASSDSTIKVYNIHTGKVTQTLLHHKRSVTCLEIYEKNGHTFLLSGSSDKCIYLHHITKGKCAEYVLGVRVMCMCLSGDVLYVGLSSGSVLLINLQKKAALGKHLCHTKEQAVSCLCVSDNLLCTASFDVTVSCWDVTFTTSNGVPKSSFKCLKQLKFSSTVLSMKVVREHKMKISNIGDRLYLACGDGKLLCYCIQTWKELYSVPHGEPVSSLEIIGEILISASFDCTIRCFDLRTLDLLQVYTGYPDKIFSLCVSKGIMYIGLMSGGVQATKLDLTEYYTCEWDNCNLRFGIFDHLKKHHLKEHVPLCTTVRNNLTTCKWRNCLQKMDINSLLDHLQQHVSSSPK